MKAEQHQPSFKPVNASHHGHGHGHHHHHHHEADGRIGLAFYLNLIFAGVELVGGLLTNSLAILSNGFHDFGDAFAIGMAWYLERKSLKGSSEHFSYGYRRLSVMAALITGVVLFLGSCLILTKAIPRLFQPEQPEISGMLGLAVLGLCVNGFAAYRMSKGQSLNEKVILVHLIEDVLGWAIILTGAILMRFISIPILDPIMAVGVAFWVLWNAFHNLKATMSVFLQAVPENIEIQHLETAIKEFSLVEGVHHTHLWSMDGVHHIMTTHVIVKEGSELSDVHCLKTDVKKKLFDLFHVQEATIEIEWPNQKCADPKH